MDIFENPLFSEAPTEDDFKGKQPSPRNSANQLLQQTRNSVSSILKIFKPSGSSKKKEKDQLSQSRNLETLLEESHPHDETGDRSLPIIESESEVAKLKYENSLINFSNKELMGKLEESEKEMVNLKDFLKVSDEKMQELSNRIKEQEMRYQGISEDLLRIEEDNRRLLEVESSLKGILSEKELQIDEFSKGFKEKEFVIKEFEINLKALNQRLEEEKIKQQGFYEEQIGGLREKMRGLEGIVEGFVKKESVLNEMQHVLEDERRNFQENLRIFEENLTARDNKIHELQGVLSQKEDLLLRLEGNKQLISSEKQEISHEILLLTEKYEQEAQEFHQKEAALLQENRELLDAFESKRNEISRKEESFSEDKKALEEALRTKEQELYREKEEVCEERLKLSNERLELEQKMRRLTQEIEELQSKSTSLSSENQLISSQLEEIEQQKTIWLEEKSQLESRLIEEKAKELSVFSNDLEAKSHTMNAKLEEAEIENLVLKERISQFENQSQSLKSQLDSLIKEKEMLIKQIIEEKQQFQREKQSLFEQKRTFEQSYKQFEGSIQEKETMIQELMGNIIEKESYIRNSVIEKDSEVTKLKEIYEQEIGFYKKNEQEKNLIYENLMNKLVQGEKLLQTKQNTLTYFQENYQKILKEKENIEGLLKNKTEALQTTNQNLENSQETLNNLERRLKEYSIKLENLQKDLEFRGLEKEETLKKVEETYELKLKAEKSASESKIREKDVENLHLRQELNRQKLQLEEKATEAVNKALRLEQEYQNKLLDISKGSEISQKETLKKLEDLLDRKSKDLAAKEKKINEIEDSIKRREREIKELRENNRELQEKVSSFLKEKEAYLKENSNFREQKLRVFEARMQEMQVRFNGEIESLSLQKLRLREDYELKLDGKAKEIADLRSLRKVLEEKVMVLSKEKEIAMKEAAVLKEKLVKTGGLGSEETGNWISNVTKELKIELRLLQEEKKRLIEDYESRLKSKEEEIETLKEQALKPEREERSKRAESPEKSIKKRLSFKKKPIFKENEVFDDVNRLKEKVKNLLIRYQRLLEALKEKQNLEINLRKYLTDPVNEIMKLYMKVLLMYYEASPSDLWDAECLLRNKAKLLSLEQCQDLQTGYLESGGNLEKDLNENMRNCLDFIIEFYSFADCEVLRDKSLRQRGGFAKGPRGGIEALPEGAISFEKGEDEEENKAKKSNEISIRMFKVLEKVNSNLQNIKSAKIKEKVLIFCIIIKSFLNNESHQMGATRNTVLKDLEDLKGELEGHRYFVALFNRIERLLGLLSGEIPLVSNNDEVLEAMDSDLEA